MNLGESATHGRMTPRLMLLASLLFSAVAYLFLWVQLARGIGPVGAGRVWIVSLALYGILMGILLLANLLSDSLLPDLPEAIRAATERVGIARFETWGTAAALAGAVAALLFAPQLLPLPVLGGLGFLAMLTAPARAQPLEPPRSLYRPPRLPEEGIPLPEPVAGEPAAALPEGTVDRLFSWSVTWAGNGRTPQQMKVTIGMERLGKFRDRNPYGQKPPPREPDYQEFIRITDEVSSAACHFETETRKHGWTPFHEACNVLAFVQSIPYSRDEIDGELREYFRYPIETLHDETGDCEDSSILAAALLKSLGHTVVILEIAPAPGSNSGHVAIGMDAAEGFPDKSRLVQGRYLFCETTQSGWHVGEVPEDLVGREMRVCTI